MTTSFYEELRKSDSISDENENAHSRVNIDKWIFRLLLFLIGIMPLIVMANVEEVISPLVSNVDVLSSGTKGDLFTHYKALLLLIITVITGAMLLVKILFMGGEIRKTFLNYVLGILVVAITVSTIASPNVSIALNGQYNRSDGAISWLCYISLMFIAMNIEYPKKVISYIMYTMIPFVFINLYIITMNFYGKDLLQNSWAQKLVSVMLPEGSAISDGSILVGTLNQWNYMSGMFAMMTVMYLAWALTSEKWIENTIGSINASASIIVMFMSLSKSGFITVIILSVILILILVITKKKINAFVTLIIFFIIVIPVFHNLSEKNPHVWTESLGIFTEKNPYKVEAMNFNLISSKVYANDEIFELPVLPEWAWSKGSGRLYIWGKTVELVKQRVMLGYGGDTLIYNFPHYNIDARSGIFSENTIVDKPHNEYIGVLYGFGIVGLISMTILLFTLGLKIIKSIIIKSRDELIIGITVLAYFIQAMFNDSIPATTATAFIFFGIFIVVSYNRNERKKD